MVADYLDDGRSVALGQPIREQNGSNDRLTIEKGSQTEIPAFFFNPEYLKEWQLNTNLSAWTPIRSRMCVSMTSCLNG